MAASAPKKSRREDLNVDPQRRILDFLTVKQAGRMRSTEMDAQGREFSAYRTKITVPKSLLPLRHLYDDYSDDDDDPTEDLASISFWELYNLETVTEIDARKSGITTADLRYIAEKCPKLASLNISGHNNFDPSEAVVPILEQCRNLTTLWIEGIRDTAFTALSLTCPKLTFLQLHYAQLTDRGLRAISQRCPYLTHLDLMFAHDRYTYAGVISSEGVIALAEGCPQLTFLELGYLREALNLKSLFALAVGCPLLSVLNTFIDCDEDQEELEQWIQECYPLFAQNLQQQLIVNENCHFDYGEIVIKPASDAVGASGGGGAGGGAGGSPKKRQNNLFPGLRF